jgi:hypothetical protein
VNFIMGFPGEAVSQMFDSFTAAVQARLDWNSFFIYQPLKSTELYLAHGGMGDDGEDIEHGKECQGPRLVGAGAPKQGEAGAGFNPVRGGAFRNYRAGRALATGWDVADLDPELCPDRAQLKELWFTFNYVANFLCMPALTASSDHALANGIRWLDVLARAYPEDAAMSCVLSYLRWRRDGRPDEETRNEARRRLRQSAYWRARDAVFAFSTFLDGAMPSIDARFALRLGPVRRSA